MAQPARVINMDDHRSDGPQLENGFVRVANELEDALLLKLRTFRHSQVVRAVIRKTYGYGKKEDDITISQIAEMTGLHRNHVGKAVKDLEEMKVLQPVRAGKHGLILGLNKHHQQWQVEPTKPRGAATKTVDETTKLVAQESNQNGCAEQPKQLSSATKLVDFSNQKVAHNRQPQKTTPKDNPKRESGAPAAQDTPALPDWLPADLWRDFVAARQEAKKPLTATATKRMLAKIERLKAEGHCPAKLLENSILNRWTDIYAKPETMAGNPGSKASALKADNRGLVAGLLPGSFL